jgi:YVTN family beta-propeller protein
MDHRASRLAAWVLLLGGSAVAADLPPFVLFETGQVRPLALSVDNARLFATNTPFNRLEIFSTAGGTLSPLASVPVGLEPIAVAIRSDTEVWVVNHLSDSVSIVDVSDFSAARVVRTLLVGDEPRDIVFAGPKRGRAFITTAHRGQRLADLDPPLDPQLTTPSIGRADVWVFDADNLGDAARGTPIAILNLFSDTPRALAPSADGSTVYAAAFNSGNRTTVLGAFAIDDRGLPPPLDNVDGVVAPRNGLIVKFRNSSLDGQMHWMDEREDVTWDDLVRFNLPDKDVFVIDANANPPAQVKGEAGYFTGVGTVLFNMVVNPASGKIYVSNTDAKNEVRFEGAGSHASRQTVRGHLAESRITVLSPGEVTPRHLNKHIDYTQCCAALPNEENQKSLAFPQGMAVSSDGQTLYVAALGSSKVGVFSTAALEDGSFQPDMANQIPVSGGGPSGLALDEAGQRLYVLTRFNNSISVIDTASRSELSQVALNKNFSEPENVTRGRRILYDATLSSHGDSACASCHIFGDFDGLAWDLGDPDGHVLANPNPFEVGSPNPFHPMKGPMTTQSLRGMDNHGPMHWRGDRTGAYDAESIQPNGGAYDEEAGFKKFKPAFISLLGRNEDQPLADEDMQAFSDFVRQIMYPPNPIRNLDNSLTPMQQEGRDFYFGGISDIVRNCNGCHVLDPHGNEEFPEVVRPGFFGTDGKSSEENEPQQFKIPHLRNAYQKVGMFGMAPEPAFFPEQAGDIDPTGDQVRGFGMLHDGSVDTVFRFHGAGVFIRFPLINPDGIPFGEEGYPTRRALEAFIHAFDTNLAPIVGQQMTLGPDNFADPAANARIDLLEARADVSECQVVVKGLVKGQAAAFLYQGGGTFMRRPTGDILSEAAVRALANQPGGELTFTCVPPGSGMRIADEL